MTNRLRRPRRTSLPTQEPETEDPAAAEPADSESATDEPLLEESVTDEPASDAADASQAAPLPTVEWGRRRYRHCVL